MTEPSNALTALSFDMERLATAAATVVATIAMSSRSSAILWQPDLLVTSEQCLAEADEYRVVLPGGAVTAARLVGRDAGSNVAVLRGTGLAAPALPAGAEPALGGLALVVGGDGAGGATVRLAMLHQVGPPWHSQAGGRIDRRIMLDARLGQVEEGGPVIDAAGRLLGMSTLGPRGRALVIPTSTIVRVVQGLVLHGRVARGWLGVALQPVAVPEELHATTGHQAGLMVMGLTANSPAATAGVMQGDVLLAIDGQPVLRPRAIAERFGPDSVGTAVALSLLRAGQVMQLTATITARP